MNDKTIKRTKMKTAKQLIKEYLDKGSNMPIEGMALLTKFECELLMEQYAQEVVKNNFALADVSGQSEQLLQAFKEGFSAAVDSLKGANEIVQKRSLQ